VELDGGGTRTFLEDGDRLAIRGHARGEGYRIGFGDCTGRVLPAVPLPDWARGDATQLS
jgi:fumarylacetoacetase